MTDSPIKNVFPTEIIELPSKGLLYDKSNPLSAGTVEMKYMTAKEEDILTSPNLVRQGIAIERLLKSLIVTDVNQDDVLVCDKNAIVVAARVLAYGKDYEVTITCLKCGKQHPITVDLTKLQDKDFDSTLLTNGNKFSYTLPNSKRVIEFKMLTTKDEKNIEAETEQMKKVDPNIDAENSTRLKYMITSVDGVSDNVRIRSFVDNEFLSKDAFEFRKYVDKVSPAIDMSFDFICATCDDHSRRVVPMTVNFFWPRI